MAYDGSPSKWWAGYNVSSEVLQIADAANSAGVSAGTFTCDGSNPELTFGSEHGLALNQIVQLTTSAADLPDGFSTSTDYYVVSVPSATTVQLSASRGGAAITAADAGTGTHTCNVHGMLPELASAEANASTGDIREVFYALAEGMYQAWNAKPTADRPNRMTLFKSVSTNVSTGIQTVSFTSQFELSTGAPDVAEEE